MTNIDWNQTYAAIWRQRKQALRAVKHLDPIRLTDLLGIDHQKRRLVENTERFINHQPANNVLLWGSRGTGKSSLIKALLNEYAGENLRVIQVDKQDLIHLPEIVDDIRELNYRFIIYCDDLSFEAHESHYKALKSALEGSIELPPNNLLIYATSNRRHLLPEYMADNRDSKRVNNEIHHSDAVEERISLSDRFGVWLSFYPISQAEYLAIVDHYFQSQSIDKILLHEKAKQFALEKGSRSGRTAKQFYHSYSVT